MVDATKERKAWAQNDEDGLRMYLTRGGIMLVLPGDYVIRGIQGEIYPCKPDIFDATYLTFEE